MSGHILGPLKGPEVLRGGQRPLIGAKGTQTALCLFHFVSMETLSFWAPPELNTIADTRHEEPLTFIKN